jgi:RND superfamily putative drug exporter
MVLAATFLVVGLASPTTQVRQLGVAIALGILLDTFLVRTLLVPSTVSLLGRWNWWPSALARTPDEEGRVQTVDEGELARRA